MHQPGRLSRVAWTVVGLLWVVALLNYLDRQLVVTMPGPIKADLGIGDERFGLPRRPDLSFEVLRKSLSGSD